MMMSFSSVKVLHEIPGRLRIKIPGLKYAEKFATEEAIHASFKQYKLYGVKDIQINFITSSILVFYDTEKTNKENIVQFLNKMQESLLNWIAKNKSIGEKEFENIITELKNNGFKFE